MTTNMCNQNYLKDDEDIDLAVQAVQDLDRLVAWSFVVDDSDQLYLDYCSNNFRVSAQLVDFKKDFSKSAPYMISEYVTRATLIPIHPVVKVTLLFTNHYSLCFENSSLFFVMCLQTTISNAMYNLISICEIHGIAQLPVLLNVASKELFRTLYAEYEKYFKYTGKA